jgi:hypothetical protein
MNQVEAIRAAQSATHISAQSPVADKALFPSAEIEKLAGQEPPQLNAGDSHQKTRASELHLVHSSPNQPASVAVAAFWDHDLPEDLRQLMNRANQHNHVRLTSDAIRSLVLRIAKAEAEVAEKLGPASGRRAPFLLFTREQMGLIVDGLIVLRGDMLEPIRQIRRSSAHYSVEQVTAMLRMIAKFFAGCENAG